MTVLSTDDSGGHTVTSDINEWPLKDAALFVVVGIVRLQNECRAILKSPRGLCLLLQFAQKLDKQHVLCADEIQEIATTCES